MFNNIGKKIKTLSKILCWVGVGVFAIFGIVLMAMDEDYIPYAMLSIMVGPVLSWVCSFFMYGFGELIDKTMDIERHMRGEAAPAPTYAPAAPVAPAAPAPTYAPTAPVAPAAPTRNDKLDALRAKGLISEEEYNALITK